MAENMTERTEEIRYLTEEIGVPEDLARLQLRDDDLWVLIPEQRFAWEPGDEDVAQWQQAYEFIRALTEGFDDTPPAVVNQATSMLLWDLRDRAAEALRRAQRRQRERVSGAAGEDRA